MRCVLLQRSLYHVSGDSCTNLLFQHKMFGVCGRPSGSRCLHVSGLFCEFIIVSAVDMATSIICLNCCYYSDNFSCSLRQFPMAMMLYSRSTRPVFCDNLFCALECKLPRAKTHAVVVGILCSKIVLLGRKKTTSRTEEKVRKYILHCDKHMSCICPHILPLESRWPSTSCKSAKAEKCKKKCRNRTNIRWT